MSEHQSAVCAIIAAVSPEWVIGVNGVLPWHYPADLKRFKRLTVGHTVVMGRLTWASLPTKPLANRRNFVVTHHNLPGVACFPSVQAAAAAASGEVWFIGGERIFAAALDLVDRIDLTFVPDRITETSGGQLARFPHLDPAVWYLGTRVVHEDDPRLERCVVRRREMISK